MVGAGVIGASIGYHLLRASPNLRVVMIEAEQSAGLGATSKATGGVRHQFGTEANIKLSLLSVPYFQEFQAEFGIDPFFRQHGYLFVTSDPAQWDVMTRSAALQNRLGVPTQQLSPGEVQQLFPLVVSEDLLGGNFCSLDGSIDPHSVCSGFLSRFRDLGGQVRYGHQVLGLSVDGGGRWVVSTSQGDWEAGQVVLAAGPRTRDVAALAGAEVPSHPFRRQVFIFESHHQLTPTLPFLVDMETGWYAHVQREAVLLGGTDKDDRPGPDPRVDMEMLPRLHAATLRRLPAMADSGLKRAYAGVRQLTPDHHAILGPVDQARTLFVACGFSGHGIMHSPAVGLLTAEWVLQGRPVTWDASCLSIQRFATGQLIAETAVF